MPPKKICSDRPLKKNEIRDTLANCYKRGYNDALKIEKIANKQTTPFESVNIDVGTFLSKKPKKTASSKFTYKSSAKKQTNPYEEPDIKYVSLLKKPKETASSNFYTRKQPKKKSEEGMNVAEQLQMMANDTDIGGDIITNEQPIDVVRNINQAQVVIPQDQPQGEKSISKILARALAGRTSKSQIDVLISNAYFNVEGLTRNEKKKLKTAGMINLLKQRGYVD
jgi:hypothetical protein